MRYLEKKSKSIGIIIQARLNSKRFPNKVIKRINGVRLFKRVYNYCCKVDKDFKVIFAIPSKERNSFGLYLKKSAIPFICGPESNVLSRYFQCAKKLKLDYIVRITCDDPIKDPSIIKRSLKILIKNRFDVVTTERIKGISDGLGVESFNFEALKKSHFLATRKFEREHVTQYFYQNLKEFKIRDFTSNRFPKSWRFTVDNKIDFKFFDDFFKKLDKKINSQNFKSITARDFNYIKSLQDKYYAE